MIVVVVIGIVEQSRFASQLTLIHWLASRFISSQNPDSGSTFIRRSDTGDLPPLNRPRWYVMNGPGSGPAMGGRHGSAAIHAGTRKLHEVDVELAKGQKVVQVSRTRGGSLIGRPEYYSCCAVDRSRRHSPAEPNY